MGKITKILIANRGEIAIRVIKTAKRLGIKTVAVYSDADKEGLHVQYADEAYHIGASPSSESYLRFDKIIEIAKKSGANAIHPGYGFLSENADFAKEIAKEGITFIGPSPKSILMMGNKLYAKDAVKNYDIPMVPGTDHAIAVPAEAVEVAKEIGFPILIKAAAGGGGKGMRVVYEGDNLEEQMERAISEAQSSFGDPSVFVEKYIENPRHIEIQILADNFGNVVHLFERECSIQRRHQKVVEEAPSAVLTPELRNKMGNAAILVAKSCEYSGAGTVEFLLDKQMNFYFLEMNTRLQVEHPVTEWITGLDLVEQQIKVANNEVLDLKQEELRINGHAIELRIYAEDAENNFLPATGTLERYYLKEDEVTRLDNGYSEGQEIPIYYDPMLAKLITYGNNRSEALRNMTKAINNFEISGVITTLPFGEYVMNHEAFISGDFDTDFVNEHFSGDKFREFHNKDKEIAALIAAAYYKKKRDSIELMNENDSNWQKR